MSALVRISSCALPAAAVTLLANQSISKPSSITFTFLPIEEGILVTSNAVTIDSVEACLADALNSSPTFIRATFLTNSTNQIFIVNSANAFQCCLIPLRVDRTYRLGHTNSIFFIEIVVALANAGGVWRRIARTVRYTGLTLRTPASITNTSSIISSGCRVSLAWFTSISVRDKIISILQAKACLSITAGNCRGGALPTWLAIESSKTIFADTVCSSPFLILRASSNTRKPGCKPVETIDTITDIRGRIV